jgi:hypothetical protein
MDTEGQQRSALNTILSMLVAIFDALHESCVDIARRLRYV